MMQSLLPAIYPILKDGLRPRLRADRADHAHLPAHGVAAAAGGRRLHRPPAAALLAGRRHGLHAGRPAAAVACADSFRAAAARGRAGRHRLVDLPSGVVARRAAWPRAGGTASRSRCSRSAAISARRSARCSRPSSSLPRGQASIAWFSLAALLGIALLLAGRRAGTSAAGAARAARAPAAAAAAPALSRARCGVALADPARADLLEVLLHGEPQRATTPST